MNNRVQIFNNDELNLQVRTILNEDGSISVNAEDTAIGFGWYRTEVKNGREYLSIRWATLNGFCKELGFANLLAKDDYIPEGLFYMLGMKANNERAVKFQKWIAMDLLPTLRKTGTYSTNTTYQYALPPATFEGAANLSRVIERVMKLEGAYPHEIAMVVKSVCSQAGIDLLDCFVKIPAYEQLSVFNDVLLN